MHWQTLQKIKISRFQTLSASWRVPAVCAASGATLRALQASVLFVPHVILEYLRSVPLLFFKTPVVRAGHRRALAVFPASRATLCALQAHVRCDPHVLCDDFGSVERIVRTTKMLLWRSKLSRSCV